VSGSGVMPNPCVEGSGLAVEQHGPQECPHCHRTVSTNKLGRPKLSAHSKGETKYQPCDYKLDT